MNWSDYTDDDDYVRLNTEEKVVIRHKSRVYDGEQKKVVSVDMERELTVISKESYLNMFDDVDHYPEKTASLSEINAHINKCNDFLKFAYRDKNFFVYSVAEIFINNKRPLIRNEINKNTRAKYVIVKKRLYDEKK